MSPSYWVRSGAHHPERPSTLYLWSNLCPDWAIFRHVFPANFCLHCGSYMTELKVERDGDQSEVPHPSSVFLNRFCPFPRWFRPYADHSRDGRSRETILKIAQSGHRNCLSDLVWEIDALGDGLLVRYGSTLRRGELTYNFSQCIMSLILWQLSCCCIDNPITLLQFLKM